MGFQVFEKPRFAKNPKTPSKLASFWGPKTTPAKYRLKPFHWRVQWSLGLFKIKNNSKNQIFFRSKFSNKNVRNFCAPWFLFLRKMHSKSPFFNPKPRGISVSGRGLRVICGSFYGDSIPMPPPGHPDHPVGAEVQLDITAEKMCIYIYRLLYNMYIYIYLLDTRWYIYIYIDYIRWHIFYRYYIMYLWYNSYIYMYMYIYILDLPRTHHAIVTGKGLGTGISEAKNAGCHPGGDDLHTEWGVDPIQYMHIYIYTVPGAPMTSIFGVWTVRFCFPGALDWIIMFFFGIVVLCHLKGV